MHAREKFCLSEFSPGTIRDPTGRHTSPPARVYRAVDKLAEENVIHRTEFRYQYRLHPEHSSFLSFSMTQRYHSQTGRLQHTAQPCSGTCHQLRFFRRDFFSRIRSSRHSLRPESMAIVVPSYFSRPYSINIRT